MVAAVVQDALTGQILWVGRLHAEAPRLIAETGDLEDYGVATGQAVSVRHISMCGDGLVIHVEGLSTRMQLDSLPPEAGHPASEPPFVAHRRASVPTLNDSGSWLRGESSPPMDPPELEGQVRAFEQLLRAEAPGLVAERGTILLATLLEALHSAGVALANSEDAT